MSSATASFPETAYSPYETASDKGDYDTTRYQNISNSNGGTILAQTTAQETTVTPEFDASYTYPVSEQYNGTYQRADDTMRYVNQVHNALEGLVSMLVPNRTTHNYITTVNTAKIPNSPPAFGSHTPTTTPAMQMPVSTEKPFLKTSQVDLIFLNATSPSYIALGHGNNSFVMVWQAPVNKQSTPASPKILDGDKLAETWTKRFYYWTKVLFFTAGGVFALIKAIMTIVDTREQLCAWLAYRRTL
jgi:hypothetical protein